MIQGQPLKSLFIREDKSHVSERSSQIPDATGIATSLESRFFDEIK